MSNENERFKARKLTPKQQKAVFDVAKKYSGEVTLSNIYSNTNLSYNELNSFLATLSTKDYVKSKIDSKTGVVKYLFPEIIKSTDNRKFYEKVGLDKLFIKLKYGGSSRKPIEDLERAVILIAENYKGKLTIPQILEIIDLDIEEIEYVLISLCSKGLCIRNFENATESEQVEYIFPEIFEISQNQQKEIYSGNIVDRFVSNFTEQADRFMIRAKVTKYRAKSSFNRFLDTVSPGLGHFDGRLTFAEYLLFIFIPFILTAGISYIPSMAITRYNTFKHYSISEDIFKKNVYKVNRNSLIYALALSLLYAKAIGLQGLIAYYAEIFKIFGLG